jgi:small subunit ribosomal protein S21
MSVVNAVTTKRKTAPSKVNVQKVLISLEVFALVRIKVRHGESLEQALRRFNKKVNSARILKEALARSRFEKPSLEKRRKEKEKARKIYLENKYR